LKPPKFVINSPDLDFGELVADLNFPNPLVADWIEILAFTCPIRPAHTPSVDTLNKRLGLKLTEHDINSVYRFQDSKTSGYQFKT